MRGNIGGQAWDQVVLQEQSDEALRAQTVPDPAGGDPIELGSNFPRFQAYANLIENWIHQGAALDYRERALFAAIHGAFDLLPDAEVTFECEPGTLRPEKLEVLPLGSHRIKGCPLPLEVFALQGHRPAGAAPG